VFRANTKEKGGNRLNDKEGCNLKDENYLKVQSLINWLHDRIEMEVSCYEDLEMTEGLRNDFHRGKEAAFEELLKTIEKP